MSRYSDYQFVSTDTRELTDSLTLLYEKITKSTVLPASPEQLFLRWIASILLQERVLLNYAGNQNIPSRAEGANLDALAELTHCRPRPEAQPASCTMRFHLSQAQQQAVLIPAGTRVTDAAQSLFWETLSDVFIPSGETSVDTLVRCQTPGIAGNGYPIGRIDTIVDVYEYYSGCENITLSGGGADRATDEEYYELMKASMDAYSCAGARGGYIYFAKQVSTRIADVIAASPTPGVVKLYVLMEDGTLAGEEIKRAVLAACSADEVRPLTDLVLVEDAGIAEYDIDFTYYIQTGTPKSGEQIAEEIDKAVSQFTAWQSAKLGRDINPSYLISLLMQTGIKRVELRSPSFAVLQDGSNLAAPQLAKVRNITVRNGGFEDE